MGVLRSVPEFLGKGEMTTAENNKAVIRKFLDEVINQNRMDRADDLVVEDFVELDRVIFCDAVGEVRELLFFPAPEEGPGESK
jgi:hypothetical protein